MQQNLVPILEIQELDMKLIRLMRLKKERQRELDNLNRIKSDLQNQQAIKENEIFELKKNIRMAENELKEVQEKIKQLESRQNSIKKVEEFNALSHEIAAAEKDKHAKEQRLSDMYDRQTAEEDLLKALKKTLEQTNEDSHTLENEIIESIRQINAEGRELETERNQLVQNADPEVFKIYERLLRNKKDRVVVPIENRACSGCHIVLTAQDENLVRKGERLIFCEHCSRIHYWQESAALEGTPAATRQRRRRGSAKA